MAHHSPAGQSLKLRRLHPEPVAPTTVADAYEATRAPWPDRPWVGLCMITSLDGTVAIDGTSGGLGNPHDLEVLLTLRSLADMLIVGSGTIIGEGYGAPKKPGQRIGVVTTRSSIDLDTDLFTSGAGFLITTDANDVDERRVDVLRAGQDRVDMALAVRRLHQIDPTVRYVQAEGGAGLNGSLLDADVVDELDLSWSPHLVGGDGPRLAVGGTETLRKFELAHVLADNQGYMFTRWLRHRDATTESGRA